MARMATQVPESLGGLRLDQVLAELFSDFSRSKLQTWVKAGRVTVNGRILKPKDKLAGGEAIELDADAEVVTQECRAEAISLDIVYEDESLLIVAKPAGMVVHPAAGNWTGTLQNALLHHYPASASLPRAGIVHRLDKETSGLLMIAKTLKAHYSLVRQLQDRSVHREYLAIVRGHLIAGGRVDEPIGRHPRDRKRFAVSLAGKPAVTHYRVVERFRHYTLLRVKLETGRTHQIRVHLAHIHFPLVGDPVYGGRFQISPDCGDDLERELRNFRRQALHAEKLGIVHPDTGDYCEWLQPIPDDMSRLVTALYANEQRQALDKR